MIRKSISRLIVILTALSLVFVFPPHLLGDEASDLRQQINQYSQKLTKLGQAKKTLKNEITYINSRIELTRLQIIQTENSIHTLQAEIADLSIKIDQLDVDLNALSSAFIYQTDQNYKLQKKLPPFVSLIFGNFNEFLKQQKYLTVVQKNVRDTLVNMETVRTNYAIQKQKKTQKQQELELLENTLAQQKVDLSSQGESKNQLLTVTQNDEAKFQKLLRQIQGELAAIEAIIAGKGVETVVGPVKKGSKIAYVIQGDSCLSDGTHLHFMVKKDNNVQNPFSFLNSVNYANNSCSPSSSCQKDPFNPSGNWPWPLKEIIKFNQGYGNSWAVNHISWLPYEFHTGIDIASTTSNEIFATQDGTLYRGSYSYGCKLQYVRVESTQDNTETLYLHVNYF